MRGVWAVASEAKSGSAARPRSERVRAFFTGHSGFVEAERTLKQR